MARVTPKENFLMLAGGGHPEYVPFYTFMGTEGTKEIPVKGAFASVYPFGFPSEDGFTDMWGVPYAMNETTANAGMPAPGRFIIEDITKWGDIIKRPEPENLDFDAMLKTSMEMTGLDRSTTAMSCSFGFMPFQQLMGFMGHTEGLAAMYEEPEAVKELLEYLLLTYEPYIESVIDTFKPDIWSIGDDTCTETAPFFSVEMYKEFFKPIYTRLAQPAIDRGIPIIFHICGMFEPFIDDMLDFGVKYVEPAQETNDIMGLKEKYKNRLSFIGGYDWGKHTPPNYPNFDEAWIRQDVRDAIDRYSPGGAYGIIAWPISYLGDEAIEEVKRIIWDEAVDYGKIVYGYPLD